MANFRKITTEFMRGENIQWDSSNKWDFELQGLNDLFEGWVSATSLELGFWGITTEGVGSSGADYISGHTYPTLTLSYLDPEDLRVTNYFTEWIAEMASHDGYEVQMVSEAARQFDIHKTDSTNESRYIWTGKVIPTGNVTYTGDSDASVPMYQIQFTVVAGSMKWSKG